MPVKAQQAALETLLQYNSQYLEEKALLEAAGALMQGELYKPPDKPALAVESIDPSGKFEVFFNVEMAGLSFLEDLDKGLSTTGGHKTATWE